VSASSELYHSGPHSSEPENPADLRGFVDLHSHTDASDGSLSPSELIELAVSLRLDALAITDHDTFAGYAVAAPVARDAGLDLVCGIELNTRLREPGGHSRLMHLLAYFLAAPPTESFMTWLGKLQQDRRDRNEKLVKALRDARVEITLEEVERIGRSVTGRPHFARVLIKKGYAADYRDAFRRFLGEDAPTYVEHESPNTEVVIAEVLAGGGLPVVPHPVRLMFPDQISERLAIERLQRAGLAGLEVYHSDHSAERQAYYLEMARSLDLVPTGGSDFHGAPKPDVALGTGRNNVRVPAGVLAAMRDFRPAPCPR
jgi:predicted metal-dependent phosphoesterase TrpH